MQAISRTIGEMRRDRDGASPRAVEEQGAATQEIARNGGQAASGTQEVTAAIVGLTEASGAVGASAGEVLGDADGLSQQSDRLREQMQQFLARVRAA